MITTGRLVIYRLSDNDVKQIQERRQTKSTSYQGNYVTAGEEVPLVAVRIWPHEYGQNVPGVNGQALLDGADTLWVTSAREGAENGQWHWPIRD